MGFVVDNQTLHDFANLNKTLQELLNSNKDKLNLRNKNKLPTIFIKQSC